MDHVIVGQKVAEGKIIASKQMRREMTPAETILWSRLRANKLGAHFRRQQIIKGFIADFYCHKANLVIECDGSIHDPQYDSERDKIFVAERIEVLRFSNDEVFSNIELVIGVIQTKLNLSTP